MDETIAVEFIVNAEAVDQLDDVGIDYIPYGPNVGFVKHIDETLFESLTNDELVEFIGIDSEFLVYLNTRD